MASLQFYGFAFTGILGTVLHFLYNWTKQNVIIAPFSAVNESTWEHMKILFWPMFIFSFFEYLTFCKDYENFWFVKLTGIVVGLILIPAIFYTYIGVTGKSSGVFNILIFFIAAGTAYYIETQLFQREAFIYNLPGIPFILLCILALLFVAFTFFPPEIPLFQDPIKGTYGIKR